MSEPKTVEEILREAIAPADPALSAQGQLMTEAGLRAAIERMREQVRTVGEPS